MATHTRIFNTEEEARAFAEGLEFAIEYCSLDIDSIEIDSDIEPLTYNLGPWVVTIADNEEEGDNVQYNR